MSFANDLTLKNSTGANITYTRVSESGTTTTRIDTASTLTEPRKLEIKHTSSGSNKSTIDRHLLSNNSSKFGTDGVQRTATVNLTFAVPRDASFTQSDIANLLSPIVDFISQGFNASGMGGQTNLASILRGEG